MSMIEGAAQCRSLQVYARMQCACVMRLCGKRVKKRGMIVLECPKCYIEYIEEDAAHGTKVVHSTHTQAKKAKTKEGEKNVDEK